MNNAALYFIEAPSFNLIKIGNSRNAQKRLRHMLSLSPCTDLRLLRVLDGQGRLENFVHSMWADCRSHGEWFHGTDELRSWIDRGSPMDESREPEPPALGRQIRKRREALGLGRLQLALQLDPPVDPQTIYEWETDRYLPEESRRPNLAKVLKGTYRAPRFVFGDTK